MLLNPGPGKIAWLLHIKEKSVSTVQIHVCGGQGVVIFTARCIFEVSTTAADTDELAT